MISYGSQLATLKRQVIQYITDKTKEPGYKNDPDILKICQSGSVMAILNMGSLRTDVRPLQECSVERLCNIADKIHFRPIERFHASGIMKEQPKQESVNTQTSDMSFEIKSNIPLPGQLFTPAIKAEKKSSAKQLNYRSLPLKEMKVGDCIILHECDARSIASKFGSSKSGIEKFVSLMDTKKKFKVAKTDDLKVGVWRVE